MLSADFGSTFSGVLTDEHGRVRAIWGSFSTQVLESNLIVMILFVMVIYFDSLFFNNLSSSMVPIHLRIINLSEAFLSMR